MKEAKKDYSKPKLDKQERLATVTEGGSTTVPSSQTPPPGTTP